MNRRTQINRTYCRLRERIERNAIANRQKRMRSECTHGVIGYWRSAIRSELQASLPVYLVRSARTVWSSAPLLDNWNHSKVQQAIATRAEAPEDKDRNPFTSAEAWRGGLGANLPQTRFRFRFYLGLAER